MRGLSKVMSKYLNGIEFRLRHFVFLLSVHAEMDIIGLHKLLATYSPSGLSVSRLHGSFTVLNHIITSPLPRWIVGNNDGHFFICSSVASLCQIDLSETSCSNQTRLWLGGTHKKVVNSLNLYFNKKRPASVNETAK